MLFREHRLKRQGISKEELHEAYNIYLDERESRLQALQEEKWTLLCTVFKGLLTSPEHSHILLAGNKKALYETIFRCQPRKFITRARFMTAMRLVCRMHWLFTVMVTRHMNLKASCVSLPPPPPPKGVWAGAG